MLPPIVAKVFNASAILSASAIPSISRQTTPVGATASQHYSTVFTHNPNSCSSNSSTAYFPSSALSCVKNECTLPTGAEFPAGSAYISSKCGVTDPWEHAVTTFPNMKVAIFDYFNGLSCTASNRYFIAAFPLDGRCIQLDHTTSWKGSLTQSGGIGFTEWSNNACSGVSSDYTVITSSELDTCFDATDFLIKFTIVDSATLRTQRSSADVMSVNTRLTLAASAIAWFL